MKAAILDYLKNISTWKQVGIYTFICFVSLITYWGYRVTDTLIEKLDKIERMEKALQENIMLSSKQAEEIRKTTEDMMLLPGIEEVYIRVLQPDNFIKKTFSELIYAQKKNISWEEIKNGNHWWPIKVPVYETPFILLKLKETSFFTVRDTDNNYIGTFLKGAGGGFSEAQVHGLYLENVLVGYCVVFMSSNFEGEAMKGVFKGVQEINNIIFFYNY